MKDKSKNSKPLFTLVASAVLLAAIALLGLSRFAAPLGWGVALAVGVGALIAPVVIKNPAFAVALIGFFLPFERVPAIEIAGANLKINHFLIILVGVLFVGSALIKKQLEVPRDPIRAAVLFFVLALTFSYPLAANKERAAQVIGFMVLMAVVYLVVTLILSDKERLKIALKGILWGAAFSAVLGFYQFAGDMAGLPIEATLLKEGYDKTTFGFARVQATAQEPLYFANYLFIPLALLAVLLLRGKVEELLGRKPAVLLTAALLVNFILTVSRGAFLAAAVAAVALAITQAKLIFRSSTVIPALALFASAAILVFGALSGSEERALDEFTSHVRVQDREEGESVVARLDASRQALELFETSPLVGVGAGNFGPRVQGEPDEKPEGGWFIVNNQYLELLAEGGIIALVAFLAVLIVAFGRVLLAFFASKDGFLRSVAIALALAAVGVFAQYATFSTIYIFHIWFLLALIASTANIILNETKKTKS